MARTNGLVYAVIKERIKADTKNLPPDTRLPARIKLMETYKVARSSIEKAIVELVGEGCLLRDQHNYLQHGS
jgi:DNA-binding GntR family transcriptional regulator